MVSTFLVLQDQCLACNNQVLKELGTLQGVFGAELDRIEGRIVVHHTEEVTRDKIAGLLASLGFPERPEHQGEEEIKTNETSVSGKTLRITAN
ncbi:MAG: heavy metal-associated domain-containing protein [Bacteroidota bacterium]|nr:heavy metal-associated domain-containing protein [Bacteroidota bacterium]